MEYAALYNENAEEENQRMHDVTVAREQCCRLECWARSRIKLARR